MHYYVRSRFGTCPSFPVLSLPSSGHQYSHIYPSVLSAPIRRRSPHERPAYRQAQRPRWGSSPLPTHIHPRPHRLHRLRRVNQPAASITRALRSTRSSGPAPVLVQKRVRSGELRDRLTTCARGAPITSLHVQPGGPPQPDLQQSSGAPVQLAVPVVGLSDSWQGVSE